MGREVSLVRQQKRLFEEAHDRLRARLKRRRLFLNPFKLDPVKHMQRYAMTDQEWGALKFLTSNPEFENCVRDAHWVTLAPGSLGKLPFKSFQVDPRGQHAHFTMININVKWGNLPEGVREYIMKWAEYDYQLKESSLNALAHFRAVGDKVRTWGQLYRLWPTLLPLYPQEMRAEIGNKKAKSKIPDDILIDFHKPVGPDGKYQIRDIFLPERIEQSDMVFAEMMMLPVPSDIEGTVCDPSIEYRNDRAFRGL